MSFSRDVLGVEPIPWQRWLLIHALEIRPDRRFRFRTVLILVARQAGKTTIIEVKNLWKMFVLRVPMVIGTAQNLDISEESWDKAVEIVESIPELDAEKSEVSRVNGKKSMRLRNGSRWKIAAASRRGGRGMSGDDVNLDELREHQTWESWAAVTKTTMARRNAQVFAFSNAGDDKSVVLNDLQEKGRAAAAHPESADLSLGLFEWSAPDDVQCTCGEQPHAADCRLQDRRAWAMANPSLGYTVTEEALASALATDPEPIFRTECLCQRVPLLEPRWSAIGRAEWLAAADVPSRPVLPVSFGIEVDWNREWSAIAVAWRREDGLRQVEITQGDDGLDHRPGTGWVVPRVKELMERWHPSTLVIDPGGPAGSLVKELEDAEVTFETMTTSDAGRAYGWLRDGVSDPDVNKRDLRHGNQPALNAAVAGAVERQLGQQRAWDRKLSRNFCPLGAATAALWMLPPDYDILQSVL